MERRYETRKEGANKDFMGEKTRGDRGEKRKTGETAGGDERKWKNSKEIEVPGNVGKGIEEQRR